MYPFANAEFLTYDHMQASLDSRVARLLRPRSFEHWGQSKTLLHVFPSWHAEIAPCRHRNSIVSVAKLHISIRGSEYNKYMPLPCSVESCEKISLARDWTKLESVIILYRLANVGPFLAHTSGSQFLVAYRPERSP